MNNNDKSVETPDNM